jgi:hypothetical protein
MKMNPSYFLAVGLSCLIWTALVSAQAASEPNFAPGTLQFQVRFEAGAIVSLKRVADRIDTEYLPSGRRLGDITIRYRQDTGERWQTAQTATLAGSEAATFSTREPGREYKAVYRIAEVMTLETGFVVEEKAIVWTLGVTNTGKQRLEIGDLALPLAVGSGGRGGQNRVPMLKHSFVSGHGSFLFWMRGNSVGPYLTLVPSGNTQLEY